MMLTVPACCFGAAAAGSKGLLSSARKPPTHPGGESCHVQDGVTKCQDCRGDIQSPEIRSRPEGEGNFCLTSLWIVLHYL